MRSSAVFRAAAAGTLAFALGAASLLWLVSSVGPAASATLSAGDVLGADSLYQLESPWQTDDGRSLRLHQLRGRFQVLALIFTRCPGVCPTLVRELQSLEKALPAAAQGRTGFVLVTIDPEHDTPEVLREYRKKMGLAPERWTLLRGEPDDLRELAATLGFNYEPSGPSGFAHSRLITVLEPGGRIVHQQADLAEDPGKVVSAIHERL